MFKKFVAPCMACICRLSVMAAHSALSSVKRLSVGLASVVHTAISTRANLINRAAFSLGLTILMLSSAQVNASCTVNGVSYRTIGAASGLLLTKVDLFNQAPAWNNSTDLVTTCDVSHFTSLSEAFKGNATFNQDLSAWDTAAVTNMGQMFKDATSLTTVSLSDTSAVTSVYQMFEGATSLTTVSLPDTSAVTNIFKMFNNASAFNQDIRGWDVTSVTSFTGMFSGATAMISNFGSTPNWNTTPTSAWFVVPIASELAAKSEDISKVLTDDAQRSLNSALISNTRLTRDARGRLLVSRKARGGDDSSIVSSKNVPFDVDGTFTASNGNLATKGNFFAQTGNFEDTQRRLVFGDFNLQRDDDSGSTTATISGKMAWEQMLSEKTMLGYYLGGELGRSDIKGSFTGTQDTYGISIGGYFVHALQQNMFVDGFASLGVGRNDLKMADDTLDLESNYTTRTVAVGAAISGSIEQSGYDILPELRVTYGKTSIGDVGFTGTAYGNTDDTLSLHAGSVSKAAILLRPEFRVPMNEVSGFVSTAVFSFAPRLMCERVKVTTTTNDCGRGAEIGINSTSEDSLSVTNLKVIVDRVGSSTRQSLQYNLEYKF
jgi:surface protein